MRLIRLLLGLLTANLLFAEDIETLKHEVYKDATITRTEPDGIVITYAAGIVKILFTELGDDYKKRFGYNEAAAKKFADADAEQQRLLYLKTQQDRKTANERDAKVYMANAAEVEHANRQRAIQSFVLQANERGTGSTSYDTWKTSYGSYDRQTTQNKTIVASVHDVRGSSAVCMIDAYFVGRSLTNDALFVYSHQAIPLTVDKGQEARTEIMAPQIDSRVLNLAALGEQYAQGAQMEGWIVTAKIDGQRFGAIPSQATVADEMDALIHEFEGRSAAPSR